MPPTNTQSITNCTTEPKPRTPRDHAPDHARGRAQGLGPDDSIQQGTTRPVVRADVDRCPCCTPRLSSKGEVYYPTTCEGPLPRDGRDKVRRQLDRSEENLAHAKGLYISRTAPETRLRSVQLCGRSAAKDIYEHQGTGERFLKYRRNLCWNYVCPYCGPIRKTIAYYWLRRCRRKPYELFITLTFKRGFTSNKRSWSTADDLEDHVHGVVADLRRRLLRVLGDDRPENVNVIEWHKSTWQHVHQLMHSVPSANRLFEVIRVSWGEDGRRRRVPKPGPGGLIRVWENMVTQAQQQPSNRALRWMCREFSRWMLAAGFETEFARFKAGVEQRLEDHRDLLKGLPRHRARERHVTLDIIKGLVALMAELAKVKAKPIEEAGLFAKAVLMRHILGVLGDPRGVGHIKVMPVKDQSRSCRYVLKDFTKTNQLRPDAKRGRRRLWCTEGFAHVSHKEFMGVWKSRGRKAYQHLVEAMPEADRTPNNEQPLLTADQVGVWLAGGASDQPARRDRPAASPVPREHLRYLGTEQVGKTCACLGSCYHPRPNLEQVYLDCLDRNDDIIAVKWRHLRDYDGSELGYVLDSFWVRIPPPPPTLFDELCEEEEF